MDSLQDLLSAYIPRQPDEVAAIKAYILKQFNSPAMVGIQRETIVITVASASLANALRLRLPALQAAANTAKRLVLRIG